MATVVTDQTQTTSVAVRCISAVMARKIQQLSLAFVLSIRANAWVNPLPHSKTIPCKQRLQHLLLLRIACAPGVCAQTPIISLTNKSKSPYRQQTESTVIWLMGAKSEPVATIKAAHQAKSTHLMQTSMYSLLLRAHQIVPTCNSAIN